MIGSVLGLSVTSAIVVGSGFKLKQVNQDYISLCNKKNNVQIYNCRELTYDTDLLNKIIKVEPNEIPNKKAFVGTIKLYGYRDDKQLVLVKDKNNENMYKYKCIDVISKVPLNYNIPSTYGLENAGLNIVTKEGAIINYHLPKANIHAPLDVINKELETICGTKINCITDISNFSLEKYFINLEKPIFMYGHVESHLNQDYLVCDLMSNDKNLLINKIYENETDKIINNAIGYSAMLCSGLLGSFYFLFELKK